MKAKMSYKSKKIAIITAVIVVLIAAISVGAYYFIQGNDSAQAAYSENEQDLAGANNGESETAGNPEEQTNPAEESNDENEGEANQGGEDSQEPTNVDDNTDNDTTGQTTDTTGGTTTGTTSGTTTGTTPDGDDDGNIPNEEYTQTDIIETEVERREQEVRVGWSNMALASAGISTNIPTSRPDLTINKTATVVNSLNESDNAVQVGSKITYNITVTNNSQDIDAMGVNVSDIIPEGTVLDTETEATNGVTPDENGRISWVIDVARNSSVTVSFTVVVESTEGEIENVAVVDGKDTPEVANPIINANKIATSEDEVLGEGSTVTYVITVENTGNANGTTTVRDAVPAGTTLVEGSIVGNENYVVEEINGQKVITWNNVEVAEGETVELKFTVTINSFAGESLEIRNTATVGDKDTNTETETAYNPVLSIVKEVDKTQVSEGDTITYEITVENTGKVDGVATIRDVVPEGTTLVPGSITGNGIPTEENGQTVITWNDVIVAKNNGTLTVSFQVTVNENSGLTNPISNVAYLVDENENETPTTPTKTDVEAHIVFIENGGTEVKDMDGVAGEEITDRNMPTTTRDGYTFGGWYAEKALTNKVEQLPENMVAGTTYYYAKWTANTDTKYKVEYYYEENGTYPETATSSVDREGTTDTQVSVTEADKTPTQDGYVFDEAEISNVLSGTVAGDESLVLKVYFKQQFTVNYEKGDHGTFKTQTTTGIDYGTATPAFEGTPAGEAGYSFAGWEPEVADTVTENATYVAQWTADTDTKYKVEYYYEENGTYPETATSSVDREGTTDTQVSVTEADKTPTQDGYVFDEAEISNVLSGTVAGDESLVLKVYFKQQFTVNYEKGDHGTFKTQTTTGIDYGTATPAFEGTPAGEAGYSFAGWEPEVADTVTENATYVAQWTPDYSKTKTLKYTVEYYLDGVKKDTDTETEEVWVNSDQTTLTVNKTSINTTNKFGEEAEFVNTDPEAIPDSIPNNGVIKVYYETKADPSLTLTKTALNSNKEKISELVYDADGNNYMYYRLKVENTVAESYPETVDNQTITDVLPLGMTYVASEGDGTISYKTDGEQRTQIMWTVSDIGNGNAAKETYIKVQINEKVFDNERIDNEVTTILDIELNQYKNDDTQNGVADRTGNKISIFLRTAGETNKNDGYIYAGTVNVDEKVNSSVFASDEFDNDEKVNNAINNEAQLERMLDDFTENQSAMSKYVRGGLQTINKTFINQQLNELYNGTIALGDNQVILWYKVTKNDDKTLTRYYEITEDGRQLFRNGVDLPACSYHIDGIVVDTSTLGTIIPDGASVTVRNTAEVSSQDTSIWNNITDSADVNIYYNTEGSTTQTASMNVLSKVLSKVDNDEINKDNVKEVIETIEEKEIENEVIESDTAVESNDKTESETIENSTEQSENSTVDNNIEESNTIVSENDITSNTETENVVGNTETTNGNIIEDNSIKTSINAIQKNDVIVEGQNVQNETSN